MGVVGEGRTVTKDERTLRAPDVLSLAGCTYRQLDYWCRSYPIVEGRTHTPGIGQHRRFTRTEALIVRAFTLLGAYGVLFTPYAHLIIAEINRVPDARWLVLSDGTKVEAFTSPDEVLEAMHLGTVTTTVPLILQGDADDTPTQEPLPAV